MTQHITQPANGACNTSTYLDDVKLHQYLVTACHDLLGITGGQNLLPFQESVPQ